MLGVFGYSESDGLAVVMPERVSIKLKIALKRTHLVRLVAGTVSMVLSVSDLRFDGGGMIVISFAFDNVRRGECERRWKALPRIKRRMKCMKLEISWRR